MALGPSASSGLKREAGSATSISSSMRKRYSVPARAARVSARYQPPSCACMASVRAWPPASSTTSTLRAPGAQRAKRTPASVSSAPNGMPWRRQSLLATRRLDQKHGRASLQRIGDATGEGTYPERIALERGVEHRAPGAGGRLRQHEWNGLVMSVAEQEKIAVLDRATAPVDASYGGARKVDSETAYEFLPPF